MEFFSNLLSFFALSAGYSNSSKTIVLIFFEPECPKDLL